ncbi:MAG: ATP-binding protein, partial [Bacilli bacterium]|nr:ATP-binding protein [Bacilli bacterium]
MPKIRVMDDNLANKIAAGEVVERVVSIVKELIENAIDAGSDEIVIELKESGLREIKITDNGIGMDNDDLLLAFQRHATSKIYDDDDLFNINTLGFRGEALPSIASVSEVEVKTCYKDNEVGSFLHIKGGKILEQSSCGFNKGTSFKITNLFYNTPARLKHLSSSYAELANVIDYVHKISLSYTGIRFRLINDDKELLNTTGSGNLLKVISDIYGINVAKKMVEIDGENDDY